ncbi:F0F1 ATP synthase subunit epsilon [Plastorhodobacter daqingensis]|uniref:ATP synthase epsilon chain n=1 Tax=Plastorhodobacter daqingensis TaxID=1387281 RepID=A0ABW2UP69_9RHOB
MAKTMQFDLVSPERRLTSVQAIEVQIPAAEGYMTAMPDHSPTITTLRPGVLRVRSNEGTVEFAVTGGFAEITPEGTSVLAERALPVAEVTAEVMDGFIAEAQAAADRAAPEARAEAELLVSDYRALRVAVGV